MSDHPQALRQQSEQQEGGYLLRPVESKFSQAVSARGHRLGGVCSVSAKCNWRIGEDMNDLPRAFKKDTRRKI
jgi:hypothetical protein